MTNRAKRTPPTMERAVAAERVCTRLGVVTLVSLPAPEAKALLELWGQWHVLVEKDNEAAAIEQHEDDET